MMTLPANLCCFARHLKALIFKEFRQLLRDPSHLMVGIGLPLVLIILFGYGLSLDVNNAFLAVALEESSPTTRELITSLELSPYISTSTVPSLTQAKAEIDQVDAILHIPSDFSRRLAQGDAHLLLLLKGTEPNRALVVGSYVEAAIASWLQRQPGHDLTTLDQGQVVLIERTWFNPERNSRWYLVPGLIVLITTLTGTFLTALVMAREWERGTLEALFVTPIVPVEILLAKIAAYFCVGMLGLAICLLAAKELFEVPLQGSLSILLLGSTLYLCVALGVGLVISALTKNQFTASQIAILISFMPAMMLSGFIYDLRNVPTAVRLVGQLLPATHFMDFVKSLFLTGNYWPLILKECLILTGYATLLLGLANRMTRKKLD